MLSVIVPAYNEEQNIRGNLKVIEKEVGRLAVPSEIIVVSDGSSDATYERALKCRSRALHVYHYQRNIGKGHAVSYGFWRSRGDIVALIDADLDLHPRQIGALWKTREVYEADIVIGSKRHPLSSVNYPPARRLMSLVYHGMIKALFNLNVRDTQVGLKIFKRPVLENCLRFMVGKRYAFDLELLILARHFGFKRIVEAPIHLDFQSTSHVNPTAIKGMIQDTLALFYRFNVMKRYPALPAAKPSRKNITGEKEAA